jgi:hypothetical protein
MSGSVKNATSGIQCYIMYDFLQVKVRRKVESESSCLSPLVNSKVSSVSCQSEELVLSFPECHFYQVNNFCWCVELCHYGI